MNTLQAKITKLPVLGFIVLFLYRAKIIITHFRGLIVNSLYWLRSSREITNFTYDLAPLNIEYLCAFIANITGVHFQQIKKYADEALNDVVLKEHVKKITAAHENSHLADTELRWGRRLAYYIFVRAIKPKIAVETGLDKGLGAIAITAALMRNAEENCAGHYYGTDIDPESGYLLAGKYAEFANVLLGDSVESLRKLDRTIDFFVYDSLRTPAYEAAEYQAIKDKLSPNAIVLTTFAHGSDQLLQFSLRTNRSFLVFRECPLRHYYPGGEIGVAFNKYVETL